MEDPFGFGFSRPSSESKDQPFQHGAVLEVPQDGQGGVLSTYQEKVGKGVAGDFAGIGSEVVSRMAGLAQSNL